MPTQTSSGNLRDLGEAVRGHQILPSQSQIWSNLH